MRDEDYSNLRESTNDFDTIYQYFSIESGNRISPVLFVARFNEWCRVNKWNSTQVIEEILNRLDGKHSYQSFAGRWK